MSYPRDVFTIMTLPAAEIDAVENMISEQVLSSCPDFEQRQAWDVACNLDLAKFVLAEANQLLLRLIEQISDDLYLDFYKTGLCKTYAGVYFAKINE